MKTFFSRFKMWPKSIIFFARNSRYFRYFREHLFISSLISDLPANILYMLYSLWYHSFPQPTIYHPPAICHPQIILISFRYTVQLLFLGRCLCYCSWVLQIRIRPDVNYFAVSEWNIQIQLHVRLTTWYDKVFKSHQKCLKKTCFCFRILVFTFI